MVNWVETNFSGVRYWESDVRGIDGKSIAKGKKKPKKWKPDRCYTIRYKVEGKRKTETVGWESQGITAQYCSNLRGKIVSSIKTGEGAYQSLKEKTALEKERREEEEAEKVAEAMENVPFHVLGDRYIEWAEDEKPASYKADESRYRNHLKPFLGDIPVKDIHTLTLEGFKRELKKKKTPGKKPLSPKTIQHCLTLVRQMFNKAPSWGIYSGTNPVTETAKVHKKFLQIPDNRRLRFFSRKEASKLLSYLDEKNTQLHDITLLGIYAGLRADEIFSLLWRDIDLEYGVITIKDPKGVLNRAAYVTLPLREMLTRRKAEGFNKNSLIFKSTKGEKIKEVSNAFDRAIEKLEFNKGVTDPRDRVVFHTTRHTFASWSAMSGTHLATLQKLMGHKKIEMTLRYAHLCPSHEREAAERMVQDETKAGKVVKIKKK
ncbi:MAG: site-specific integrase [Nitrospina sp.]|nr:site-specific integrase [Nitrospina sp.]MBT4389101.1 site-specific integrase [Nitrospina sp.]MBT6717591.1 site-specific integrase [Nitrospina sp.]